MDWRSSQILKILDDCGEASTFPMLDNGYVFLAATRLSLFRSDLDWALVLEVFGYSPRSGDPDTQIYTFASKLAQRDPREKYRTDDQYENYLRLHPHDDSRFVFPVEGGSWHAPDNEELVADSGHILLRGQSVPLPGLEDYRAQGIPRSGARATVFELCRHLACLDRSSVLATTEERRVSVPSELPQILQLEEWHHPDLAGGENASQSETFRQLADVLATGDVSQYQPTREPNTHWSNWPEGGTL